MKRLLVVLVIALVAFGFYRAWFSLSTADHGSKSDINFSVDKEKFKEDKDKAVEKLRGLGAKEHE